MSKFAMVFPGQGSQSIGMLAALAKEYSTVLTTFAEASEVLSYDLWDRIQHGPEIELNRTSCTQPALLASSVAIWRVWRELGGPIPAMMAGHSLGEYSALVCAESLAFTDAISLVALRGKLMQEAVPEGTGMMSAIIGLDDETIATICASIQLDDGIVAPANYNSPGQVVIAGSKAAVEQANAACLAAGAKRALPLSVSVPSHCLLMKPAADTLAKVLKSVNINQPICEIVNNVDVAVEISADKIADALVRQLYSPVRWAESIIYIKSQQVDHLLEVGPGKVLTGLTKRIVADLSAISINDVQPLVAELEKLK